MKYDHHSIPFADINEAAKLALPSLVRRWLPNGQQEDTEWVVGNLAGERGRSLRIVLSGPKCGKWNDFATNEGGGDPISLFAAVMGVGQAEAAKHLGLMLGVIEDRKQDVPVSGPTPQGAQKNTASTVLDQRLDDTEAVRLEKVRTIASECVQIDGTPAITYLIDRAIDVEKISLYEVGWHPQSGAVVYASRNPAGELRAVQRIFLDSSGRAKLEPNGRKIKRTNGVLKGSAFTLPGDGLEILVCDGPEDALSLRQVIGAPVRCAFGMNLGEVPLPEGTSVILVADNDDQDSAAAKAVAKAADRLMERGFSVKVTHPPAGIKDANDLLRLHGPDAVKKMVAAAAQLSVVEFIKSGVKEEVIRLAKLTSLDYELERSEAAKRLGFSLKTLDRLVNSVRSSKSATDEAALFPTVKPWPSSVDLDKLLDEILRTIRRYVICDDVVLTVVALWVIFTWVIDWVQVAPLLVITAPEKRCGKTQLLTLVGWLCRRSVATSNISPAAIYRMIEAWAPTLVIDEADTFLKRNGEYQNILNSGHIRSLAYVYRLEGDDHTPTPFSLWGGKAIAGIGRFLDETTLDRGVVIELRRRRPDEKVERLRHADPEHFDQLRRKLARVAEDAGEAIGQAHPLLPAKLNDRAQDNWEPLLAIADYAGGHWPETARAAALELSGSSHEPRSLSTELLTDIRGIFEQRGCDRITTADLLTALNADEERPWATYSRGRPLTPRDLGKFLVEHHIASSNQWIGHGVVRKGFSRDQFEDAFARYLSAQIPEISDIPPPPVPSSPYGQYQPPPPMPPRPVPPPPPVPSSPHGPYQPPPPMPPRPVPPPPPAPSAPHGPYPLPPPMPPRPVPPPPPALPPQVAPTTHGGFPKLLAAAVPPSASPKGAETLPPSDLAVKSGDIGDDIDL